MSAPTVSHCGERETYVAHPRFPNIKIQAWVVFDVVSIEYVGWPEDLIAAGLIQPQWLNLSKGGRRCDPDGRKVWSTIKWRKSGQALPRAYYVIRRECPIGEVSRWPGAAEALKAYNKYKEREARERSEVFGKSPALPPAPKPRPALRLVIDNTREVTP